MISRLQFAESTRSVQTLKLQLKEALADQILQTEQVQQLQIEKTALEEQISSLKIDQSDSVWSLESQLLKSESDRTALVALEKELRADLEEVPVISTVEEVAFFDGLSQALVRANALEKERGELVG